MTERSMIICGLPGSGKTTFLAALWHLVTSREIETALRFESLRNGDASHLNALSARWRNAKIQDRTEMAANRLVSMNLLASGGNPVRLTFPDLSGESYRRMWEERDCDPAVAEMLTTGEGLLLFVHADQIQAPKSVVEVATQSKKLGIDVADGQDAPWSPRLAPTQVQLVDLLQLLRLPPLNLGPQRVAIMLSAWDKVAPENRTPEAFLAERLPLFDQYLRSGADGWTWRVFGVSAQGGDYETQNKIMTKTQRADLDVLRNLDQPSLRIKVVSEAAESHDLTGPVAWLMS
jgi:double-GTPase-like protein